MQQKKWYEESRRTGNGNSNVKWKNKAWEIREYFRWIWNEWIRSKTKYKDRSIRGEKEEAKKNINIEKLKPKLREMEH